MGLAAWWSQQLLVAVVGTVMATICAMLLAALLYAVLLFFMGVVTKQELAQLPVIKKILKQRKKA